MNLKDRQLFLSAWVSKMQEQNFSYGKPEDRQRAITAVRLAMATVIPDDETRRRVLGLLFINEKDRPYSTKLLTDCQLHALRGWLKSLPAPNGEWTISEEADGELRQFAEIVSPSQMAIAITGTVEGKPILGPVTQAAVALGGQVKTAKAPLPVEVRKDEPKKENYFEFE